LESEITLGIGIPAAAICHFIVKKRAASIRDNNERVNIARGKKESLGGGAAAAAAAGRGEEEIAGV